tara:strand:- start:3266 stop:3439 length:174 start_codon:yes stop_codon:yes gene_type:complete
LGTFTYNILKDKKAAKKLLKRAKEHPDWYTEKDIYYAKMVRKQIKKDEQRQSNSKSE